MFKSTTLLAVLLGLDDQFCSSYCWTMYWEMSPVCEVTWVKFDDGSSVNKRMGEDEW